MLIQLLTEKYPGMRLWLSQRLTAVIMVIYVVFSLGYWCMMLPVDYAAWHRAITPWWWRLASALFFCSLCVHAWLGVRDVLRDYIANTRLRDYLQLLVEMLLLLYLISLSLTLWKL